MNRILLILLWLSFGCPLPAFAHQPMHHDCVAPTRPADDHDDVLWKRFLDQIDAFQACINADSERHQSASRAHQEAARVAVGSWNQFVRTSLNVPEDFPWPPEED